MDSGQTQNTRTPRTERHENTPVLCAHDKWLTNENWLNNRFVFMRPSLQPLVPLLFEIALVHATFAIQLAKLRHEFRCSWFRNGDVDAKRVDANLADLRPLLKQAHEECYILSPFHEHSMFARAMDPLLHNSRHVSFVPCSHCRLELFARDVGHCVLEPVGTLCQR